MNVPLLDLRREYEYMKADIDSAIAGVLEHQRWILGPEVKTFEEQFAESIGVKYAVGVASGTDALILGLRALALKKRKEEFWRKEDLIIVPSFTFTASGTAVLHAGATPLFVDVDESTFTLDVDKVTDALKKYGDKIVGIIPVHLYGLAADMHAFKELQAKYGFFILEDCAQSYGARIGDRYVGSLGDASAFSFFPSKNLGGYGDGGMFATDDEELYEYVTMLRKHGGKDKYDVKYLGYNSRLDTLQAAILLAKMKHIADFNGKRRHIADMYTSALKDVVKTPVEPDGFYHVYHQYTVQVEDRDNLQKYLKDKGIATAVYYPKPLPYMTVFEGRKIVHSVDVSEKLSKKVISLPIEPLLTDEEINYVISSIKEAL
ncbi:MAG: DegT/DnrJ/EryC1/StrS family aminotransferase [Dictyoglomi bacterium]|nr:DegT/DnrJ/EryC1/StrS family aminotransferase [Dictyoglomota bacterium]